MDKLAYEFFCCCKNKIFSLSHTAKVLSLNHFLFSIFWGCHFLVNGLCLSCSCKFCLCGINLKDSFSFQYFLLLPCSCKCVPVNGLYLEHFPAIEVALLLHQRKLCRETFSYSSNLGFSFLNLRKYYHIVT